MDIYRVPSQELGAGACDMGRVRDGWKKQVSRFKVQGSSLELKE